MALTLAACLLATVSVVLGAAAIWQVHGQQQRNERYVHDQVQQANRKFCDLLDALNTPAPATTERGRQIVELTNQLAESLGCDTKP